jgi:recombinational DNA repair protein (RecF pathway)
MLEHYTTAIVLGVRPQDEVDAAVTLYTKGFGKLIAKAKSLRKITSKLSGHLVPGNIIRVRLIERGDGSSVQILDALSERPPGANGELLKFLNLLDKVAPLGLPEPALWYEAERAVERGDFSAPRYRRILAALGFFSKSLACDDCGSLHVAYFVPGEVIFLCPNSLKKLGIPEHDTVRI